MQYKSVAQTRGKHLVCPLCGYEDCLIFRHPGADHDSFRCDKCNTNASALAVEMTTRIPLCSVCKKPLFKKPFPQKRGVYTIWFFECRTIGCSRAGKTIDTLTMFRGYEKQALIERTIERKKQAKALEESKQAALFRIEEKLKKERDGK